MDPTAAATLFACLDREVWLVTAQAAGQRGGLIATLVSQASHVPDVPRMLIGLGLQHHTRGLVEASASFALHLLSEDNLDLVWQFGLVSGHEHDKFTSLHTETSSRGNPLLGQTIGWLDCRVETSLDIGGRILYLGEVVEGKVTNFRQPLTWRRLMELAPVSRLTEMQRRRHHDSYLEGLALATWRERLP